MKRKYTIVLFDLDGTLLNTLEDLNLSMQHVLRAHGFPICTLEQTRARAGNGIKKLVERSLPEGFTPEQFSAVHEDFVAYYGEHNNDHTQPYPGIMRVLECLHKEGYKLGVVSNKNHEPVCDLVRQHFGDLFDVVIGAQEGLERKPAPDMVELALKQLGVKESFYNKVAYVGDSEVDILTASNVEAFCIAVTWGFRSVEQLKAVGPECIVDTPDEMWDVIANGTDELIDGWLILKQERRNRLNRVFAASEGWDSPLITYNLDEA